MLPPFAHGCLEKLGGFDLLGLGKQGDDAGQEVPCYSLCYTQTLTGLQVLKLSCVRAPSGVGSRWKCPQSCSPAGAGLQATSARKIMQKGFMCIVVFCLVVIYTLCFGVIKCVSLK